MENKNQLEQLQQQVSQLNQLKEAMKEEIDLLKKQSKKSRLGFFISFAFAIVMTVVLLYNIFGGRRKANAQTHSNKEVVKNEITNLPRKNTPESDTVFIEEKVIVKEGKKLDKKEKLKKNIVKSDFQKAEELRSILKEMEQNSFSEVESFKSKRKSLLSLIKKDKKIKKEFLSFYQKIGRAFLEQEHQKLDDEIVVLQKELQLIKKLQGVQALEKMSDLMKMMLEEYPQILSGEKRDWSYKCKMCYSKLDWKSLNGSSVSHQASQVKAAYLRVVNMKK